MRKMDSASRGPPGRAAQGPVDSRDESMQAIFALLRDRKGVDFGAYQQNTIRRRLRQWMDRSGIGDLPDLLAVLRSQPAETELLFEHLLVPTTAFFREPKTWEILRKSVRPELIGNHALTNAEPIRIWVPGCSSGEEVYSLAILLLDGMHDSGVHRRIQIFGTDVNDQRLREARSGIYPPKRVAAISEPLLKHYFVNHKDGFQIAPFVRNLCTFAHHDLLADPPFSRMDLISCQNVLLYFSRAGGNKVLQDFFYALNPGGYLVLGPAESIYGRTDLFSPVDAAHKIYRSTRPFARSVLNTVHNAARMTLKTAVSQHGSAGQALPALQQEIAGQRMEVACAQQELRASREDLSWVRDELRKNQDELELRVAERTAELQKANEALQREIAVQKRLEAEILRITEEERRRIAQDVHDGLGQQLTGAIHLLTDLRQSLEKKSPLDAKAAERLIELILESVEQTRSLAKGISPVEDEPGGLTVALEQLAQRTQYMHRVKCRFQASETASAVHNDTATHLYRIAQEAVNNAVRHARPRHIDISLEQSLKAVTLSVCDDGSGLSPSAAGASGMGLRIMEYRANLIGGTLDIIPRRPHGTMVICRLKLINERKEKTNAGPVH